MGYPAPIPKDPAATLPFFIDWSDWQANEGATITAVTWTAPTGIVALDNASAHPPTFVAGKAIVWVSGGTPGVTYRIVSHVVTASGIIDERSLPILINNR